MPHALVVDDDVDAADSLAALIAGEGFSVATARSLRAAREQLAEHEPDLVLLDLLLPDGHGFELLADTRPLANTEVVLLTGQANLHTSIQALRLGAVDYLVKPISLAQLHGALDRAKGAGAVRKLSAEPPAITVRVGMRLDDIERQVTLATLEHLNRHKEKTAATLGISLKTLYNRLKGYSRAAAPAGRSLASMPMAHDAHPQEQS